MIVPLINGGRGRGDDPSQDFSRPPRNENDGACIIVVRERGGERLG